METDNLSKQLMTLPIETSSDLGLTYLYETCVDPEQHELQKISADENPVTHLTNKMRNKPGSVMNDTSHINRTTINKRQLIVRGSIVRYLRGLNSMFAIKIRGLLIVLNIILFCVSIVQAGFWTFYFPNFLKPSGYKELTKMIDRQMSQINATLDNFADIQHFWGIMQKLDNIEADYPEESVCDEVFPMYRDMAIEYAYIDFEHFVEPMKLFHDHLNKFRSEYYPEGEKGKTILPRQWEHDLYKKELELRIDWHSKLTSGAEFKMKRQKMVNLWQSVRRGLDTSIPCIYLKYAFRQTAEDINQLALEMNLESMQKSVEMLDYAFKRTKLLENSDDSAIKEIQEVLKREERFRIK